MHALARVGFAARTYPEPQLGGAVAPSLAAISVANAAAATALALSPTTSDGLLVYIRTFKDYFHVDFNAGALVADGTTVLATSLGGTTRLVRMEIANPAWLLQAAWGINASTGNDENVGSVASPLATWAEFRRRFGDGNTLRQTTTVTLASNLPTTDPISGTFIVPANMYFIVQGGVASTLQTGTLTGVTALNRATNTAWTLVDAGENFTPEVGHRIRNTTVGARLNAISWISRVDPAGGGAVDTVRVSLPVIMPAVTSGSVQGTTSSWVNGDTYAVEQLFTARVGSFTVLPQNGPLTANFPTLVLADIEFVGTVGGLMFDQPPSLFTYLYACRFNVSVVSNTNNLYAVSCMFVGTLQVAGGAIFLEAGCARGQSGTGVAIATFGGYAEIDQDFLVQGSLVATVGSLILATVGMFDAAASALLNPLGAGLVIGAGSLGAPGTGANNTIRNTGAVALYGAGNLIGIHVASGCQLRYQTLANITVIGAGGAADTAFRLGINAVTVDVLDAAGAFATIATTYAALAAHATGNAINGNNGAGIVATV